MVPPYSLLWILWFFLYLLWHRISSNFPSVFSSANLILNGHLHLPNLSITWSWSEPATAEQYNSRAYSMCIQNLWVSHGNDSSLPWRPKGRSRLIRKENLQANRKRPLIQKVECDGLSPSMVKIWKWPHRVKLVFHMFLQPWIKSKAKEEVELECLIWRHQQAPLLLSTELHIKGTTEGSELWNKELHTT